MKKLLVLSLLSLSATAFGQVCYVDMINTATNRVVRTFTAYGDASTCIEGKKQCSKSVRLDYGRDPHQSNLVCEVRGSMPVPTPTPNPYPNPNPNPYPNPNPGPTPNPYPTGIDARRMLNNGESAILNSRYVTVMGMNFNGLYAVKSTDGWNTISNNISREALAVTNGCNLNLCVNDSVIQVNTARYVKLAGLAYNDTFVVKSTDGWNTISSNISRQNLAETKGCIASYYSQVCVGNTVINNLNRYMTVVGVQMDGRVVLKSTDGWNTITTNVDPTSLVVTR